MAFATLDSTHSMKIPLDSLRPYIVTGRSKVLDVAWAEGKITQKELAERLGYSQRTIQRWLKSGSTPDEFEKLCEFFHRRPAELLGRKFYHEVFVYGRYRRPDRNGQFLPGPKGAVRRRQQSSRVATVERDLREEGPGIAEDPILGCFVPPSRDHQFDGQGQATHDGGAGESSRQVLKETAERIKVKEREWASDSHIL